MKILDYEEAHAVVDGSKKLSWDGWDIVSWTPRASAELSQFGLRRKGRWGIAKRFPLRSDGTWKLPNNYAN